MNVGRTDAGRTNRLSAALATRRARLDTRPRSAITPTMDVVMLLRALEFASERHRDQRRKGERGAPYVNHLIEVATLLADHGHAEDSELLVAAVLHDTIEDTATTPAELESRFGGRVLELVSAVSDDKSLTRDRRRELVLEHLPAAEAAIKLIKLADLRSNVRSMPENWPSDKIHAYLDHCERAADLCRDADPKLHGEFWARACRTRGAHRARGA